MHKTQLISTGIFLLYIVTAKLLKFSHTVKKISIELLCRPVDSKIFPKLLSLQQNILKYNTMMKKSFRIITLAMAFMACLSASAQEANSLAFRAGTRSPELRNDSVTFRFVAPKARKV